MKQYLPKDGEGYRILEDPSKMSAAAVHACLEHWLNRQANGEIPLEFSHYLTFDGRLVIANPLAAAAMSEDLNFTAPRKHRKHRRQKDVERLNTDDSEGDDGNVATPSKKKSQKTSNNKKKGSRSSGSCSPDPAKARPRQAGDFLTANDKGNRPRPRHGHVNDEDPAARPRLHADENPLDAQPNASSRERTPLFLGTDSEAEPSHLDREQRRYDKAPRPPSPYEEHVDSFDYSSLDPELLAISKAMKLSRKEATMNNATTGGSSSNAWVQIEPLPTTLLPIPSIASPNDTLPTGAISESQVAALLAGYPDRTRDKALKLGFTNSIIAQNPLLLGLVHNIVKATPSTISVRQESTPVMQPSQPRGRASYQKGIGSPLAVEQRDMQPTSPAAAADLKIQLAAAAAEIKKLKLAVADQQEKRPRDTDSLKTSKIFCESLG